MNYDVFSQAIGFSPMDMLFVLAVVLLAAAGLRKHHRMKREERELSLRIASFRKDAVKQSSGHADKGYEEKQTEDLSAGEQETPAEEIGDEKR